MRLKDNPALHAAAQNGLPILPLYILDDENAGEFKMGGASRWWLHQSLADVNKSIDEHMVFARGRAQDVLESLIEEIGARAVYWNRCYEPWRIKRDTKIKKSLDEKRIEVKSFNGSLLFEPHLTLKKDGTPYKVFTPFYKKGCLENAPPPRAPIPVPKSVEWYSHKICSLEDLDLMPSIRWYECMADEWQPGEEGAATNLEEFLDESINRYKEGRNYPARRDTSRLSPHLHFGEISPHMVWEAVEAQNLMGGAAQGAATYQSELGWREFSYSLLYYFPDLPRKNLQSKFDNFPWRSSKNDLKAWQKGQTGYPIVDAGMRELWQTGYMHNRVRMIVGSFLVKNLLLYWHEGEKWFWDCLVDANMANNSAGWQWIAGCGADAAPYFRIFNPITQGQKFDEKGEYTRRFVPELKDMPDKYLFNPWEAPDDVLKKAGVKLGEDYPKPIVDLKVSRERALDAFKSLKS